MHHTIVALDGIHMAIPHFDIAPPHTATQIVHHFTPPNEVVERIRDATIVITTTGRMNADILDPKVTPKLQLIAQLATGTDNIDLEMCKKRGITVCNTPGGNIDTVAEHALALYFSTRRTIPIMHSRTFMGEWKEKKSITGYMRDGAGMPPLTCGDEICGIIGYGRIGSRIAKMCYGLGMRVLVVDRKATPPSVKGAVPPTAEELAAISSTIDLANPPRAPLATVLRLASVFILSCPLTPETRNIISTTEFDQMRQCAVVINVARGGVVDEEALATALKEKRIAGAATDVFVREPGDSEDSPLLQLPDDVHFIASPHVAWFSDLTMTNLARMLKENVEGFVKGEPTNVVV
jgi:lactate dehydrogenase-like 2-hydroxyacid dehydrogenase